MFISSELRYSPSGGTGLHGRRGHMGKEGIKKEGKEGIEWDKGREKGREG